MAKRNEIDGDLVVPGSLVVLGGFQNSSYSRTVTRLAGAESNVTVVQGQIIDRPTYDEVAKQGFETRYKRSVDTPTLDVTDPYPAGWTLSVTTGSDAIWMIGAERNFDGTLASDWYAPVRFTGAATITAVLSNDRETIPCDADGNNGTYTGAFTDMSVYQGSVDITGTGFTFGATPSIGVTLDPDIDHLLYPNRFGVSRITVESGYIDIVANKSGMDPITKRFSVSRTRIGDGTPLYRLSVSSTIVKTYPDLTISPPSILFEAKSNIGLSNPSPYAGIFKYYINDVLQFASASPQTSMLWDNSELYPSGTLYPQDTLLPPVVLADLTADATVTRCELWDAGNSVMIDSQSVVFLKDVGFQLPDILDQAQSAAKAYSDAQRVLAETNSAAYADGIVSAEEARAIADATAKAEAARVAALAEVPKYLGKCNQDLSEFPSSYHKGDWFLIYGTDDTPRQRGIWVINSSLVAARITGASSDESVYVISAMADILTVTNSADPNWGAISDYGSITFIANLVSNTAFINELMTKNLTIQTAGSIKSSNFDAGVAGFELDGETGSLTARNVRIGRDGAFLTTDLETFADGVGSSTGDIADPVSGDTAIAINSGYTFFGLAKTAIMALSYFVSGAWKSRFILYESLSGPMLKGFKQDGSTEVGSIAFEDYSTMSRKGLSLSANEQLNVYLNGHTVSQVFETNQVHYNKMYADVVAPTHWFPTDQKTSQFPLATLGRILNASISYSTVVMNSYRRVARLDAPQGSSKTVRVTVHVSVPGAYGDYVYITITDGIDAVEYTARLYGDNGYSVTVDRKMTFGYLEVHGAVSTNSPRTFTSTFDAYAPTDTNVSLVN